ncbi:2-dehydropantoate 2-reductase [Paraburkholderia sp. 1N]|jgi:2-dehydropantoate 2-reductase|uniref:2-dehydropantoate 2-reductase n=1 Tax=Paraburkholderia solitsugae TaxID=2675748 RepID=A0ABX2C567_9BURK|nr:ketopantoate reductase family protein [Paraburkholderia solitsugae]NPT47145.1 2-dehydropantoate 2-reductase [Paraburkholderia solitsugae]
MRIAILGAGGVGGYFGARLAAAGCEVTFVARGRHLEAMRNHGLRIESPLGNLALENVKAVRDISEVGKVDLVFVTVKLWDTEDVAKSLVPVVAQGAAVVSFQNSVQKDEVLSKYLPKESIVAGVCYIAAAIGEPGVIVHTGMQQKLAFGEYDGTRSARVVELYDACSKAGIDVEISDDPRRLIWEKFVFVVGLSAITSAVRKPVGVVLENPKTRKLLLDVMREVVAVGQAKGVAIPDDFAQRQLSLADAFSPTATSSMHNDLERGNRLELPWLSGDVADMGAQVNVPTPCNRVIADILSPYALGA